MRIRLDSLGRPRPPNPTSSSSTDLPPHPPPHPTSTPPPPPPPPPLPSPPPPNPSSTTKPPSKSLAKPPSPPRPEDERSSDSGSSLAEAYNSEDEHTNPTPTPLRERERLFVEQLGSRGLRIAEMRPDGNCLFRALAHVVWGDAELHLRLRARVIEYLLQERDYFSQFVAEDFKRYCRRKRREGVHGNHLELQAAAELFGRRIEVFSYSETPSTIISCLGSGGGEREVEGEPIRLSFHRGSHYNAVVPLQQEGKGGVEGKRMVMESCFGGGLEEEELERAVLALSLVEAMGGGGGSSAGGSSSGGGVPNSVLALMHSGYSEERAWEAYRVAGKGGLRAMVRYLVGGGREGDEEWVGEWGEGSSRGENGVESSGG